MADFSANAVSRNKTNKERCDSLTGHDRQFNRHWRYRLTEMPAERAIVMRISGKLALRLVR